MAPNDKAILTDEQALDATFAGRPGTSLVESGNGEWMPAAPLAANEAAANLQLSTYFHALRRHWLLATVLGLVLATIAGGGVWLSIGSRYTAEAYLRCSICEPSIYNSNAHVPTELEFEVFKNTQMSLMTHRLVLNSALYRDTKVQGKDEKFVIAKFAMLADESDPIGCLTKKLSISFPRKDELMRVSMTADDAVQAAAIVTAVRDAFMSEVVDAERKKRDEKISELNSIKIGKAQELKDQMTDLRRIADTLGTTDTDAISQKQRIILDELATLRAESIRNQFEYNRMMGELAARKAEREAVESVPISDVEVQQECPNDGILHELQLRMADMQDLAEEMKQSIAENTRSPAAVRLMGQYAKLQGKYNDRLDQLKQDIMAKRKGMAEREVKKLEAAIEIAKKQNEAAQEDLKSLKKEADRIGVQSIDMQMRHAAITSSSKALEEITSELERLNVNSKTAPRVTPYGADPEPPKVESTRTLRITMSVAASLFGFCLPFLGVVVWDLQSSRINGADDVSMQLGLPVIGSVPRIPARILHYQGTPKKSHQAWQLRLTESVDGISARLLRRAETEQRRVVMVTSAVNGEGKTTLTAQLAMSLARAGRRTLLVDFDLRRPTFDEVFGLPRAPGLSEVLRSEADLANCIHATGTENLFVLTAGNWDRFALSALGNHCVGSMFKELREDYEFVIVDTSPILPIADSRLVSQHVDSVVLCVFRDISQAPRIRAACEILEAFGVRSVDAVVTGVNERLGGRNLAYYQPSAAGESSAPDYAAEGTLN